MSSNIFYLSFGYFGGIRNDDSCSSTGGNNGCITSHPRLPQVNTSTYKDTLGSYFVKTGATVTSDYNFSNNVIIGGKTGTSPSALRDLTAGEVSSFAAQFPPGNFFPAGNTVAEREAAAGFTDVASNQFTLLSSSPYKGRAAAGGDVGFNQPTLEAAMGLVTNVGVAQAGSNGAVITYSAPDGNACAVDTSPDGNIWSRISDNGGGRARTVTVGNLLQSARYYYRILCAYEQINDGFISTEYAPDQITSGTFRSALGIRTGRRMALAVAPPEALGVTQVVGEYGPTSALGSVTAPVPCPGSCSVQFDSIAGEVLYYRWKYLNGSGAVVASTPVTATVR